MRTNLTPQLLPYLAIFVRVVEAGSFSAAARQQGSTASAVSRQIAHLEQTLGVRLLERTTRRLRLSEAGSEVFERCKDMLDAAQAALDVGERLMSQPRGRVRLSVPKAFGRFLVMPLINDFLQRYSEVDISLNLSDRSPDLISDQFDLLVSITDQPPPTLAGRPLCNVQQLLCASPTYLQRHGMPQHPSELVRHACLYLDETADDHRWHFSNGPEQCVVAVNGRFASNHSEVRLNAVLEHLGITCLPHFTAAASLTSGALVRVLPQWRYTGSYQGTAWILYHPTRHLPPKLRVLIDHLAEGLGKGPAL
ncbi:DNA-binding transcriptional LysR family regulator [Pseudomonas sp. BIGb0408]|uniref:DNA-binding transcriptional LysR family regulator n=1 Tax=Phytopseudomonas flavescens TaxID=29435 RepID=A0A7Z0BT36_9GAMM|nr:MULTISPECIES: LysR family transcriptional regulator [Pseudomonas]MCW2294895.1 DNA-binding transcriptional LysR family regulator [Pseudomonas sp. BIGb0408]NYH75831.1 DNA-binding transcriptional LysR family regulator [Pseudomonas flavescens]